MKNRTKQKSSKIKLKCRNNKYYFRYIYSFYYYYIISYLKCNNGIIEKMIEKNFNNGKNFCRTFHILAQFLFTNSERELDYYHQKVNIGVA